MALLGGDEAFWGGVLLEGEVCGLSHVLVPSCPCSLLLGYHGWSASTVTHFPPLSSPSPQAHCHGAAEYAQRLCTFRPKLVSLTFFKYFPQVFITETQTNQTNTGKVCLDGHAWIVISLHVHNTHDSVANTKTYNKKTKMGTFKGEC